MISADNAVNITAVTVDTTVPFQGSVPSSVIKANQVNVTASNLGAAGLPVAIDAANINITNPTGDIDLAGSQAIGSNVMITGPPAGFGSFIYNSDSNLSLIAPAGAITVGPNVTVAAENLTLYAKII